MAWTTPRTWVAAEVVTAALLNTHIRDNQTDLDARINAISGLVKQIAHMSTTTEDTTTSATFADTSLTLSFTPVSASSTIYVFVNHNGANGSSAGIKGSVRLMRDSTVLQVIADEVRYIHTSNAAIAYVYSESSPGTSAVTYHTEFAEPASGTFYLQSSFDAISSASSLTIVEVL